MDKSLGKPLLAVYVWDTFPKNVYLHIPVSTGAAWARAPEEDSGVTLSFISKSRLMVLCIFHHVLSTLFHILLASSDTFSHIAGSFSYRSPR